MTKPELPTFRVFEFVPAGLRTAYAGESREEAVAADDALEMAFFSEMIVNADGSFRNVQRRKSRGVETDA